MKKKLENMTMKEIQKNMESENMTFGEMAEVIKMAQMAATIQQSTEKVDEKYITRCKKLENCLSDIRDMIDEILDEDELETVDYKTGFNFIDEEEDYE